MEEYMRVFHSISGGASLGRNMTMALLFMVLSSAFPLFAQIQGGGVKVITNPEVSEPSHARIINVDLRDLPVARDWQAGDPIKEIPRRRTRLVDLKVKPEGRWDPLLDLQFSNEDGFTQVTPILNFAGQGFTGVNPPDTVGDVGVNYFIQSINGSGGARYTVYNKSDGSVAAGPFNMDALGSGSCASGLGDPVVLYDQLAGRWLISEFSSSANVLCVYVSQTSDPISGGWYNYVFSTPNFPDYPKYGVWPDGYYVGSNENTSALYALDRASMLTGAAATSQRFTATDLSGFGFQMITPADLDGATAPPSGAPAVFMRHRDDEVHSGGTDPVNDFLQIFEFSVDWNNSVNSSLTGPISIAVTDFDSSLCGLSSFSCFPQPGSSTTLDPLREVVMFRLGYRNFGSNETLVGNLVTDVDGSDRGGIRWFELRKSGGGSWSVFQEGTYSPDATNRWMGAIAMDGTGNIAMAYNVSSTSVAPGLRYVGRLSNDPLGSMPQGEFTIINGSSANNSNRYGDYASMGIDPVDDCTFWFTGMYNPSGSWATRVATFSFVECGCTNPPANPTGLSANNNGNNRIDLSWSVASGATSYRVYRADGSCPGGSYSLLASGVAGTSYSDTTVSGGQTYAYVVTGFDDANSCESGDSNCASETAMGVCAIPPTFTGLASVTDPGQTTCSLQLNWSAAVANCGSAVVYNVYRATASGFTPAAGNLIASCISGTGYLDTDVSSGTTYFYIVRAEDNSGSGSGPCAGGNEDTNSAEGSGSPTGPTTIALSDDIEGGSGNWTTAALPADTGTSAWSIVSSASNSPTQSWFVSDQSVIKDQVLQLSGAVAIPAGASATLEFFHNYNTESTFDGGVLEYSTNGGSTWEDILTGNSSRISENGYNSTISTSYGSPIGGRQAWSGNSGGFLRTTVDLADFAGNSVTFRWRMACDNSVSSTGWWVDDLTISTSGTCSSGGGCSYSINPSSASYSSAGGSGSVAVTTQAGCGWTAVSNDPWISVTSGASGSGGGSVGYSVAANASTSARAGSITIAGQTFTVNQSGAAANQAPTASFTFVVNGLAVDFDASASFDPDGTITNYSWDFGDSNSGSGVTPSHSYASAGTYNVVLTVTDDDSATDDDTQPVTVTSGGSFVTLTSDDFESGFGSYSDGGSDCRRSSRDARFAHQGTFCIRIRDNSGSSSSFFTTGNINLSSSTELKVDFWYIASSMETGEDFFVEFFDGTAWQIIASYVRGTDFNNGAFNNPSVTIDSGSYNFNSSNKIRFRCDASGNNDRIYIDEVVVSAR